MTNLSAFCILMSHFDDTTDRGWYIAYTAGGSVARFAIAVSADGTTWSTLLKSETAGVPLINTWYFIAVRHNAATDTISIRIDDTYEDSDTWSGGIHDCTSAIIFGGGDNPVGFFLNGDLDSWAVHKRILTAAEETWLAAGRKISEFGDVGAGSAMLTDCVGGWEFEEPSGNLIDAIGSNTFTASASPGSVDGVVEGPVGDNSVVSKWADRSTNSRDCVQATAAAKPTYQTSVANSYPGIQFDGTDDLMAYPTADMPSGARTTIIVYKSEVVPASTDSDTFIFTQDSGGNSCMVSLHNVAGYKKVGFKNDFGSGGPAASVGFDTAHDLATNILIVTYDGGTNTDVGSYAAWFNSVSQTIETGGNYIGSGTDGIEIGAENGLLFFDGNILFMEVCSSVLSADAIAAINTRLAARYR